MSKRSPGLLVEDIWESIEKIERYTEGMTKDIFQGDEKTTDAVVRNLEIIGEAAGRLPEDFTKRHSEIEWVKIIGLRISRFRHYTVYGFLPATRNVTLSAG
jgi:uncharacterized protein with HEPN domain